MIFFENTLPSHIFQSKIITPVSLGGGHHSIFYQR